METDSDENVADDFGEEIAIEKKAYEYDDEPEGIPDKTKKKKMISTDLSQWAYSGDNAYYGVGSTKKILPAGAYKLSFHNGILYYIKVKLLIDNLLYFKESIMSQVLKEIDRFWKSGSKFKKHGFLQRRGYLLYGPPGSGKSCLVQLIMKDIINNNGIIFLGGRNIDNLISGISLFRRIEPSRPIICLFEDIDSITERSVGGEAELLAFLDGENQENNVLNIATTNYPEKLDKRIIMRPRRFDRIIKIGMPVAETRKEYFVKKLNIKESELQKWVDASKDFSFAAMADLVISVKCLDILFD